VSFSLIWPLITGSERPPAVTSSFVSRSFAVLATSSPRGFSFVLTPQIVLGLGERASYSVGLVMMLAQVWLVPPLNPLGKPTAFGLSVFATLPGSKGCHSCAGPINTPRGGVPRVESSNPFGRTDYRLSLCDRISSCPRMSQFLVGNKRHRRPHLLKGRN
jgi:hypothetical protein